MTVRQRGATWQVEVNDATALAGYRRIRRQRPIEQAALRLEDEITKGLAKYGKWPVEDGDEPRLDPRARKRGNLRAATELALETHWKGMPSEDTVSKSIWPVIEFLEQNRKKLDIEDITSEDLDALISWERVKGNTNGTINHHLSYLSTINRVAMDRKPFLTTYKLPIKRLPARRIEKWWLTPDDEKKLLKWLREDHNDWLFSDVIEMTVNQGFRVMETLGLRIRHFSGLDGDEPSVKIPGTKTEGSEATIPVFDGSIEVTERAIMRAADNGWDFLFPFSYRQAKERWQEAREYLGVFDVETATLRALRRSFAHRANLSSMTTRTLQKVLRHNSITTTEGYLRLVGAKELDQAREVMRRQPIERTPEVSDLGSIISAYRASGATPKEIAELVKELRT